MGRLVSFYTDEHVAKAVIRGLRERGVNVMTVAEAGLMGALDEEHLARSLTEGRVLFTQDDDFLRLHAATTYTDRRNHSRPDVDLPSNGSRRNDRRDRVFVARLS